MRSLISFIAAAFLITVLAVERAPEASASFDPTPCTGNICTGSVTVGGRRVDYAYTEHIRPNGTFKIRLNVEPYSTGGVISHIVHDLPAFASVGVYKNPDAGVNAFFLPSQNVNAASGYYERFDANGCTCKVDQVMTVTFAGLAQNQYTFSLTIIQNGATGGFLNMPFYVDNGAPDTQDESSTLAPIDPGFDPPCGDLASGNPVDNDLDYAANCLDVSCNGRPAQLGINCEQPELTCTDAFDNDADGLIDCLDPSCDGRLGRASPPAYCQINESQATLNGTTPCSDVFDNDGDGRRDCVDNLSSPPGTPALTCWKQAAYGCPATETSCTNGVDDDEDRSYDDSPDNWDDNPLTGADCRDYDCAGNPACPSVENKTAVGLDAPEQCFNTASPGNVPVDDDLDHAANCADSDCRGVMHPTDSSLICFEREFDLGQSYQRCANAGFDDDGDGPADCDDDPDCKRRFGSCGPCPSVEDITLNSCADSLDNDTDAVQNCADPDCVGSLGRVVSAAHCAAPGGETSTAMCSDGFDNDVDGAQDCADATCAGQAICGLPNCSQTYACQAGETGAACTDGWDNDGDSYADCVDSGCYGQSTCRSKPWGNGACQTVPRFSEPPQEFTGTQPTVTAESYEVTKVLSSDVVHLVGTADYSTITIIIGDNTDPLAYYPYAAPSFADSPPPGRGCTLSGPDAARFDFTAVTDRVVQIFNTSQPVSGFELFLTCLTPAAPPAAQRIYPISISVLKQPGDIAEFGDAFFETTLYENELPVITFIEGEAENFATSTLRVPFGASRRFRAVPNEPPPDLGHEPVCRCTVELNGTPSVTQTGGCVTDPIPFSSDGPVSLRAFAEDAANNVGVLNAPRTVTVNVTPAVVTPLAMTSPAKPYFRSGANQIGLFAEFQSGISDAFNAACDFYLRTPDGVVVLGTSNNPTNGITFPGVGGGTPLLRCQATVAVPVSIPDGEYFLSIRATDGDGDIVEAGRLPVYVCNSVPGFGDAETPCSKADFDHDGASEGLYTQLYSTAPKACDNCIGYANPNQKDDNANGVGDACEPDDALGRCEVDRDIVCTCDSNEVPCLEDPPLNCPGPLIGAPNIDPQRCIESWGICSLGGSICVDLGPGQEGDTQCHFCDDNPAIGCSIDQDCEDAGLGAGATCGSINSPAPGTTGEGTCQGEPSRTCRRDTTGGVDGRGCFNGETYVGPCIGANVCENLIFPWLQTQFGSLFSRKNIVAPAEPPQGQFNATYCITAHGSIANFTSASCGLAPSAVTPYRAPKAPSYANVLGRIDVQGLLDGKYGTVVEADQATFAAVFNANPLDGKVYVVNGDLSIDADIEIANAAGAGKGNGTVVVVGGNLVINKEIEYAGANIDKLSHLGSIAWLVLPVINPDMTTSKGEIHIKSTVNTVSGAFFAGGDEGISTILPTETDGPESLTVYGMMVSRKFQLRRSYKSVSQGSERVIFDGRAVANPPPGLGDISKTLPILTDTPPQP